MNQHYKRIAQELRGLKNKAGLVDPAAAVDWARAHPKSQLHKELTWDDSVAAERYRIWQVRSLISVHIVDVQGDREFISLSIDRHQFGGYREATEVLSNRTMLIIMYNDCLDELARLQRRFSALPELAPVWAAVGKLTKKKLPPVRAAARLRGRAEQPRAGAP